MFSEQESRFIEVSRRLRIIGTISIVSALNLTDSKVFVKEGAIFPSNSRKFGLKRKV